MDPAARDDYLDLMGLHAWERRVPGEVGASPAIPPTLRSHAAAQPPLKKGGESRSALPAAAQPSSDKGAASSIDAKRTVSPLSQRGVGGDSQVDPAPHKTDTPPVTTLDWQPLAEQVARCQACRLHERRTQTVFGVGARNAPVMFIGEGPGEQEDLQGEPFVGAAGQLLDNMLAAIGCSRAQDVYIANVVKCRPPGNRKPSADEAEACSAYLDRQIELVAPKLLVALGGVAATRLLGQESPVGKLRGQIHDYQGRPLIVTYHPAYYLRSPGEKRKGWDDLKRIRALLDQS